MTVESSSPTWPPSPPAQVSPEGDAFLRAWNQQPAHLTHKTWRFNFKASLVFWVFFLLKSSGLPRQNKVTSVQIYSIIQSDSCTLDLWLNLLHFIKF